MWRIWRIWSFVRRLPPLSFLLGIWNRSYLINFGVTYGYIKLRRIVHIGGRYGGFKTSLCIFIAHKFYRGAVVDRIYCNFRCIWSDDPETIPDLPDPRNVRALVIFDEAGQFFVGRRDVKQLTAALRKMKLVMLLPSVDPPTSSVTRLSIEPIMDFTLIALPLVIYRTTLKGSNRGDTRTTKFALWQPKGSFGIYDTEDFPVDGAGIDDGLIMLQGGIASSLSKKSRYYKEPSLKGGFVSILDLLPSDIEESTDRLIEAAEYLSDPIQPKKAKGGFLRG